MQTHNIFVESRKGMYWNFSSVGEISGTILHKLCNASRCCIWQNTQTQSW